MTLKLGTIKLLATTMRVKIYYSTEKMKSLSIKHTIQNILNKV